MRAGSGKVDVVAQVSGEFWFYEVKTGGNVRACVREAIGQLLEYALWSAGTVPAKLIVVGENTIDGTTENYLERLNRRFPVPISYERVSLD